MPPRLAGLNCLRALPRWPPIGGPIGGPIGPPIGGPIGGPIGPLPIGGPIPGLGGGPLPIGPPRGGGLKGAPKRAETCEADNTSTKNVDKNFEEASLLNHIMLYNLGSCEEALWGLGV